MFEGWKLTRRQKQLAWFVVVVAVLNAAYRLVYATGMQQTAVLFLGLPTLLAVLLAMSPRPKSYTGALLKWSSLGLLLATVVLPEGLICLVFVLPLVWAVCVVVGATLDLAKRHGRSQGRTLAVGALPLVLLSLEGALGSPFATTDAVVVSVEVAAPPHEVAEALAATPRFDAPLPAFLRFGFNRPVAATGSGLEVGDERLISFTGGTHDDHPGRLFGGTGERSVDHRSTMHMVVAASRPGRVVFDVVHDSTMTTRWANVQRSVVTWWATGEGTTRVTWRLEYERLLYPTFYFAPLERFAASQAADYLLTALVEQPLR